MNKYKQIFFSLLALAVLAIPAMAQGAQDNQFTVDGYKALAAGLGFGLAAGLGAIGQSRIGASAAICASASR